MTVTNFFDFISRIIFYFIVSVFRISFGKNQYIFGYNTQLFYFFSFLVEDFFLNQGIKLLINCSVDLA